MIQDSSACIATRYRLDGSGIESWWRARFSAPVQAGPGTHSVSYSMGTVSFAGVNRPWRGVNHPRLSSAEVKEIIQLYLYPNSRPTRPVLGCTLSFISTFTARYSINEMYSLSKDAIYISVLFSQQRLFVCAELNCSFYIVSPACLCVKLLCRYTVRSKSRCALRRIKLNSFRPVSTLVDITSNKFYTCTATFRTQICRMCMQIKLNGFGSL
jgi:hypothetical protein